VACMSVNDCFVMQAWGKDQKVAGKVSMLSDMRATFSKLIGFDLDLTEGLGSVRCSRFALVLKEGIVTHVVTESKKGVVNDTKAEALLALAFP